MYSMSTQERYTPNSTLKMTTYLNMWVLVPEIYQSQQFGNRSQYFKRHPLWNHLNSPWCLTIKLVMHRQASLCLHHISSLKFRTLTYLALLHLHLTPCRPHQWHMIHMICCWIKGQLPRIPHLQSTQTRQATTLTYFVATGKSALQEEE